MLKIKINGKMFWNEQTEEFVYPESVELELEHSLVTLSKWESIHEKPFLTEKEKTPEERLSYVQCMIMTPDVDEDIVYQFSEKNFEEVAAYIDKQMTATWFTDLPGASRRRSGEVITNELVYYWMTAFNIDRECENWHLNRLFTLIRVTNEKNQKPKKMSKDEAARHQAELNRKRREATGSSG